MRKKLLTVVAVVLIALAAYAAIRIPQWKTEDDIREAVFRYQLAHYNDPPEIKAYYLSIGSLDIDVSPRSAFLRRFRHHRPPVKSVAACTTERLRVQDRLTGEEGLILRAGRIIRIGWGRAEVEGGCYRNGTGASGNVYTVVRKHGRWLVVKDKYVWLS